MFSEPQLRKWALASATGAGVCLCFLCICAGLWFLQGREFWATSSRTVAGVGADVHTAVQPVGGVVASLQGVTVSATRATDALTGLVKAGTPVVANLSVLEGHADALIARTDENLNRGCLPGPCGTLSDINKTLGTLRGTAGQTEIAIHRFNAHEDDLFAQEADFYAGWKPVLANTASMTGSWAGISADARKVADKATADYLKPVPWYLWPAKKANQLVDIGAAVARHTP